MTASISKKQKRDVSSSQRDQDSVPFYTNPASTTCNTNLSSEDDFMHVELDNKSKVLKMDTSNVNSFNENVSVPSRNMKKDFPLPNQRISDGFSQQTNDEKIIHDTALESETTLLEVSSQEITNDSNELADEEKRHPSSQSAIESCNEMESSQNSSKEENLNEQLNNNLERNGPSLSDKANCKKRAQKKQYITSNDIKSCVHGLCYVTDEDGNKMLFISILPHHHLVISGIAQVECLLGSITVCGYKVRQGDSVPIFSPPKSSPIAIEGSQTQSLISDPSKETDSDISFSENLTAESDKTATNTDGCVDEAFKTKMFSTYFATTSDAIDKWNELKLEMVIFVISNPCIK